MSLRIWGTDCLHGYILRQGAVAIPVREAEHPLSHRQTRRTIAEGGDYSGQLVPRDRRCSVTVAASGPGRGPRQFSRDESRRMNLNDDVVYRCLRLRPLYQLHPGRSRSLVRHNDRLHGNCLPCLFRWKCYSFAGLRRSTHSPKRFSMRRSIRHLTVPSLYFEKSLSVTQGSPCTLRARGPEKDLTYEYQRAGEGFHRHVHEGRTRGRW